MTRGRRWSVEEEKKLAELVKTEVSDVEIAKQLGKSVIGIRNKISHLRLEDDKGSWFAPSSSSSSSSFCLTPGEVNVEETVAAKPIETLDAGSPLPQSSSPSLVPPKALSSPEEALNKMAAAVVALEQPNLGRNEIQRLKSIILGAEKYQDLFAKVAQYRELEERMAELEAKYFEVFKTYPRSQNDAHS